MVFVAIGGGRPPPPPLVALIFKTPVPSQTIKICREIIKDKIAFCEKTADPMRVECILSCSTASAFCTAMLARGYILTELREACKTPGVAECFKLFSSVLPTLPECIITP